MKTGKTIIISVPALVGLLLLGAENDPLETYAMTLDWEKPEVYPPPLIDGMKVDTLNLMLESGNLQWYGPRPETDSWDGVVGQKIHAPPEVVWEVISDYELTGKILPEIEGQILWTKIDSRDDVARYTREGGNIIGVGRTRIGAELAASSALELAEELI